jgi:hypothetical protein
MGAGIAETEIDFEMDIGIGAELQSVTPPNSNFTGWHQSGIHWFYFIGGDLITRKRWLPSSSGSHWYYLLTENIGILPKGSMHRGGWIQPDGIAYFARPMANVQTSPATTGPIGSLIASSSGTVSITINGTARHFNSAGVCTTNPQRVRDARIRRDSTCNLSLAQVLFAYDDGTINFNSTFRIDFDITGSILRDSNLNGTTGGCAQLNHLICNQDLTRRPRCADDEDCNRTAGHHKGSARLNAISLDPNFYTLRLVGHSICWWGDHDSNGILRHGRVGGLGNVYGKNIIIDSTQRIDFVTYAIEHELTHNLGASHNTCHSTQRCALKTQNDMGRWCDNCRKNIWYRKWH